MLKIRMQRIGRKHDPAFRVVVIESTRGPKSGDFIERVGHYHAKTGDKSFNKERISYWIDKGAKPSDTVHNFLIDAKIISGPKINVLPPKKEKKAETKEEGAQEATTEPVVEDENKEDETPASPDDKKEETDIDTKEEKSAQGETSGDEKKEEAKTEVKEKKEAEPASEPEATPDTKEEKAPS